MTKEIELKATTVYGTRAQNRFKSIEKSLLVKLQNKPEMTKLNVVNTWVNGISYKSDKETYGVNDYWATLYKFVGKNKGDCEDYTIAKYYILKELGINPNRMKFTYVLYTNRLVLPASKRSDIIKVLKMINGDTGLKSKKWKKLEANMKRKKL